MKYFIVLLICMLSVFHVHAQSLSLFDVDASNFPTMKAKFYAFDASELQQHVVSDIRHNEIAPTPIASDSILPTPKPIKTLLSTLKLTQPNGGELYGIGNDIVISWEGVLESDTVRLDYSTDNGVTWNLIIDKVTGLKYIWQNIPPTMSEKCLIKVTQNLYGINDDIEPDIEWQKTIGGSGEDKAHAVEQTSDSGYIVAGWTKSIDGDFTRNKGLEDFGIVKLSQLGAIEWQRTLGGSEQDVARAIKQTYDGGYIVAGLTSSKDGDVLTRKYAEASYWILKLTSTGVIEWQKIFGGGRWDYPYSIQQTKDSGYVIAGYTNSFDGDVVDRTRFNVDNNDFWVVKITSTGIIEWQRSLGGSDEDMAESIQQTSDGGYIVAGHTVSADFDVRVNKGSSDYWVIKLSSGGTIEWEKTFGGSGYDAAESICQTSDGGYIVVGNTASTDGDISENNGKSVCWIVKLWSTGTIDWQKTFKGKVYGQTFNGYSGSIQQTPDNGFIIAETISRSINGIDDQQDYWIMKLNSNGDLKWQKILGGSKNEQANCIKYTKDGGYIVVGSAVSRDGDVTGFKGGITWGDFWIVKLGGKPVNYQKTDISDMTFSIINDTARTTIIAQDITAQAGEKVNLILKLQKPSGMQITGAPTEWYARIHYNKSILYNEQTSNVCPGTTDSCVLELTGVYNPQMDELISIPCITTLGNTDYSPIVIDTFYWKNSAIVTEVATQNGSITLNGICEDGGVRLFIPAKNSTSLSTRPNPAQDNLQIHYGLREPLTVTLELLTMTGQVVQTILSNQTQVAGQYTLTSDLGLLGNGVYLLRLRTNKEMLTTRVDVVK